MNMRPFVGVVVVIAAWGLVTVSGLISPLFLPSLGDVAHSWVELVRDGPLVQDLRATLSRTVVAWLLSMAVGLIVGIPLGVWPRAGQYSEAVIDFFRSMPSPALIPLAMLILGLGNASRIAVAAFTCSLINIVQTAFAVRSIPRRRIVAAHLLGARGHLLLTDVLFPSMLPTLVAGWRITVSLALIIIIVTEMFIGTQVGMGMRILDYHLLFRIPEMYAVIITVGGVGYGLNKGVEYFEHRFVHWTNR